MEHFRLGKILDVMGTIYQSVAVRIVCIADSPSPQAPWLNALTLLDFTYENEDLVAKRLAEHEKRHGVLDKDYIRIIQKAMSYAEFGNSILPWLTSGGEILLQGTNILLERGIKQETLFSLSGHMQEAEPFPEIRFSFSPPAEWSTQVHQVLQGNLVRRDLIDAGFPGDVGHILIALLDLKEAFNPNARVMFRCVMPAKLETKPVVRPLSSNACEVVLKAQCHKKIKGISAIIFVKREHMVKPVEQVQRKEATFVPSAPSGPINDMLLQLKGVVELDGIDANDPDIRIDVDLHCRGLGPVSSLKRISLHQLMDSRERNPLLATLTLFCSEEKLGGLLTHPQSEKVKIDKQRRSQYLFEVSISWLLSILGFSTIWLHDYDKISDPNTQVHIGAADVIAFHAKENVLLVIQCTLSSEEVDEKKRSLQQACQKIQQEVTDKSKLTRLAPVIFLGTTAPQDIKGLFPPHAGVCFFDTLDLAKMMDGVKDGQETAVLNAFRYGIESLGG